MTRLMSRNEARAQHVANILAGVTGVALAWFKYAATSQDPYSSVHPAEPWVLSSHLIVSPLLIFTVGLIWRDHVWAKLRKFKRPRRRSGLLIAGLFIPMALSAYLIQASVDEFWRKICVTVHLSAGGLWVLGYLAHRIAPKR